MVLSHRHTQQSVSSNEVLSRQRTRVRLAACGQASIALWLLFGAFASEQFRSVATNHAMARELEIIEDQPGSKRSANAQPGTPTPPDALAGKNAWSKEQLEYFERKVRPLLAKHCFECHGEEKHKGGLSLASRESMLRGGPTGSVIDLKEPESSLLLRAVRYESLEMPPSGRIPAADVAILAEWIKQGAPWPGSESTKATQRESGSEEIVAEGRSHWSFQPVRRPLVPQPAGDLPSNPTLSHATARNVSMQPLDLLVESALQKKQLTANGRAPTDNLVRRVFFTLTGLPPTYEELQDWTERIGGRGGQPFDQTAYASLIDQLLARPAYGEHWARQWLDVVRFAQSNGYERDGYKPYAWRYRDYVVQSFAQDKPYDRFVIEQLAGDELPDADAASRIATGFYRLGVWDDEPDDARQAEFDGLDDVLVTIGASFMGMTIGCARCHEHKFDPITQSDYYRLLAFIRNVRPYANPEPNAASATALPIATNEMIRQQFVSPPANGQRTDGLEWALAVRESGLQVPETHLLIRGSAGTPGAVVEPGFPAVLNGQADEENGSRAMRAASFRSESPVADLFPTSGRRLALARWIASRDNPLTARVIANRVWYGHFGRGIVPTTADFGVAGEPPSHPELLDWLADELVRTGWSLKHLHRTILLSETFCRDSGIDPASGAHQVAMKEDPGNRLMWHFPLRRLSAEAIRDRMLSASGELSRMVGGKEIYPRLSGEVLAGQSKPGLGWELSPDSQRVRRSIYSIVKRGVRDPLLEAFDYANTSAPLAERPTTTVAPQALVLLHGRFTAERAERLADQLLRERSTQAERIALLCQEILQRNPTAVEASRISDALRRAESAFLPLAGQMRFQTDVPVSLFSGYRGQLRGEDFLIGPPRRWEYFSGKWGGGYEGIDVVDAKLGPFALWQGGEFRDGVLTGRLRVGSSVEYATIMARARTGSNAKSGEPWSGVAVTIDRKQDRLELRDRTGAEEFIESRAMRVESDRWYTFRWELSAGRSRWWILEDSGDVNRPAKETEPRDRLEGDATEVSPESPPMIETNLRGGESEWLAGRLGLAVWGGNIDLDRIRWSVQDKEWIQQGLPRSLDLARHAQVQQHAALPAGWTAYDGQWTRIAGNTWQVAQSQGAKMIWDARPFKTGEVEVELRMTPGRAQIGGLILRVSDPKIGADNWFGYEVSLNAGDGSVLFGEHRNNWMPRRTAPYAVKPGEWHHLRVELELTRLRIFVDRAAEPQIDIDLPEPLNGAGIGLRTWGSEIQFRNLRVRDGGEIHEAVWPAPRMERLAETADSDWAKRQALAAMARVLFNANEFVYVD